MAARLSTRISLRRLPDPPSEPTDTVVLNVGSYFMDLRIRKDDGSIDWAFAGKRLILSEDPLKCKWLHTIDSRGSTDPDEGTFTTLPNGDELETGEGPCPEKGGVVTKYEEVWRALPVPAARLFPYAWILESEQTHATQGKAFLGKVGGEFVSMEAVEGGEFRARREEWSEQMEKWEVKYDFGGEGEPRIGGEGYQGEDRLKIGDVIQISGRKYRFVAWEDLEKEAT